MLTTKKRLFADAWNTGASKTKAAIAAGYSEATARFKGSELSKDKDVLAYLERVNQGVSNPDLEPISEIPATEAEPEADAPPKLVTPALIEDPLIVMRRIMNDNLYTDPKLALDAAAKLAPYVSQKLNDVGMKERKTDRAKKAVSKFNAMKPPKLVVNS